MDNSGSGAVNRSRMASQPLDAAAISDILGNAGPAFLQSISIEPIFMSYLVQAKVLNWDESEAIQDGTDHARSCNALLSRLRRVSSAQFVDFCLVLCDKQNKQKFVTEDLGLNIEKLRAEKERETVSDQTKTHHSEMKPEELVKQYTALSLKEIERLLELGQDDLSKWNEKANQELDDAFSKWSLSENKPEDTPLTMKGNQTINIVLLGITGAGKSSTGNLLVGEDRFETSSASISCTRTIRKAEFIGGNVELNIIDSPGFSDTTLEPDEIVTEISKVMEEFSDGIDAILYVFSFGNARYSKEQKASFNAMQKDVFGQGVINNCFAILTHIDSEKKIGSLPDYIVKEGTSDFGLLLNNTLQRRVIAVNNADQTIYGREVQRQNIVELILARKGKRFTSEEFQKYKRGQEMLTGKLPEHMKYLSADLHKAVSTALLLKSYGNIKALESKGSESRKVFVQIILKEMMQDSPVEPKWNEDVQHCIEVTLTDVIHRLIGGSFWKAIIVKVILFASSAGTRIASLKFQPVILKKGLELLQTLKDDTERPE